MGSNNKMKILLTGGFGFIGKKFIEKYGSNYEIIVFAKNKCGSDLTNAITKFEHGSVKKKEITNSIINNKPDIVIHLAALTGIKKCQENPEESFQVNVNGTINVIKGCIASNAKLIFISSREVYGTTKDFESKEEDVLKPINVYGVSKMIAETKVKYANKINAVDYTILRLTNVYGPGGQDGVHAIIKDAVNLQKIKVNGGDQLLNFVYVDDVVDVIHRAIKDKRASCQIFNVGSTDTLKLREFSELVSKLVKTEVKMSFEKKPETESSYFRPSIEKLRKVLGFSPNFSIEMGLMQTINWFMEKETEHS